MKTALWIFLLLLPKQVYAFDLLEMLGLRSFSAFSNDAECDAYKMIDFPNLEGMKNVEAAKKLFNRGKYCEAAQWFVGIANIYDRMAPVAAEEASYNAIL